MKEEINLNEHGCYSIKENDGGLRAVVLCAPSLDRVQVIWSKNKERILFKYCHAAEMSIREAKLWLALQRVFGFKCPPGAKMLTDRQKKLLEVNGTEK